MSLAVDPEPEVQPTPVNDNSLKFLKKMASLVPGIIYIFNHETQSNEYANRSIAELLGYSSQELIDMGDGLIETTVYADDLPGLVAYFDRIGQLQGDDFCSFEYRGNAKDGSIVWLRSIDTVFERAADGSILRHIGIAFDVTAEKEAQQRLVSLNRDLEETIAQRTADLRALNRELEARVEQRTQALLQTHRELEQLGYVAAHDLKVPINNMASLTHMLEDARDLLPAEHAETLGWMREVCDQAAEKLEALVCVAQANAVWDERFRPVDIAQTAERALTSLHYQIRQQKALVRTDFQVAFVDFLPLELENILQSLLSNALKYRSADRRPRICLRSYSRGDVTCIEVSDNGSGVDLPQDAAKVFGLFQRAHVSPPGAGVALYSIRRVMERLGGALTATGKKGEGCSFVLEFPVLGAGM